LAEELDELVIAKAFSDGLSSKSDLLGSTLHTFFQKTPGLLGGSEQLLSLVTQSEIFATSCIEKGSALARLQLERCVKDIL
jgi:hypothetical protein